MTYDQVVLKIGTYFAEYLRLVGSFLFRLLQLIYSCTEKKVLITPFLLLSLESHEVH
jgi:hypothetical protein